jgi:multicomponent Na+:H+ antiporter subunit G
MTGLTLAAVGPLAATGGGPPEVGLLRAAVVTALVAVGTFFLFVGTVGLLRLPDVYNRLHATSKATTLGAASMFLAGVAYYGPGGSGLTSLVGIAFLFITAPTGGHVISRAAKRMGVAFFGEAEWPAEAETWDEE